MPSPAPSRDPSASTIDLEPTVAEVERRLAALALSLRERDSRGVDTAALALQRALAAALDGFGNAARNGSVPPALRQRLVVASGQVAAQRETLARATAALDRAIDVLLPRDAAVYTARGTPELSAYGGLARA